MSHKNAPPPTEDQVALEAFWKARKGTTFCGFGRDANGQYFAEFARDALAAWQAASAAKTAQDLPSPAADKN